MKIERKEFIVVGAGPAGLSAAIEAARSGVSVTVFDENARPGGQLFKQIHKFFGSKEHMAKIRGFRIGEELLREAEEKGVEVVLNATVIGLYREKEIQVQIGTEVHHYKADAILIATGASENMVNFRGWTLPGVIGAGAAQTMMNLYHVKPGNRILMLGSGNVGLVVSYQLMQAGCEVVALVDAAPRIGGYGVHASKVARCGVPFYLSHTIKEAEGTDCVRGVTIAQIDAKYQFIPGTEKHFDVDTICVAVGLSPMTQLLKMDGVEMADTRGGYIPACDETGATSIPGIFAAGDVAGIEEASSAMIEGRMSGEAVAAYLGYASADESWERSGRGCSRQRTVERSWKRRTRASSCRKCCWKRATSATMRSSGFPDTGRRSRCTRSSSAHRISHAIPARLHAGRAAFPSGTISRRCR